MKVICKKSFTIYNTAKFKKDVQYCIFRSTTTSRQYITYNNRSDDMGIYLNSPEFREHFQIISEPIKDEVDYYKWLAGERF